MSNSLNIPLTIISHEFLDETQFAPSSKNPALFQNSLSHSLSSASKPVPTGRNGSACIAPWYSCELTGDSFTQTNGSAPPPFVPLTFPPPTISYHGFPTAFQGTMEGNNSHLGAFPVCVTFCARTLTRANIYFGGNFSFREFCGWVKSRGGVGNPFILSEAEQ